MNEVLNLWDVYNSPNSVKKVSPEEIRLRQEVNRLTTTISSLEEERDGYLNTIEELKQRPSPKPYVLKIPKRFKVPRKNTTAFYNAIIMCDISMNYTKFLANQRKKIQEIANDAYNESLELLRNSECKADSLDTKAGVKLLYYSQAIQSCLDEKCELKGVFEHNGCSQDK